MTRDARPGLVATLDRAQREALQPEVGVVAEINRIADQLCGVIEGDHDFVIQTASDEVIVQKLCIAINFLLETVRRSVEQAEAKSAQLERNVETIAGQRDQIRSLGAPLLRVREDVLVLPLVGVLDEDRCARISEGLLREIAARRARHALLDITGVAFVDTRTARFLGQLARAVALLGARCVLTGVQPGVAQSLVGLGVELAELTVARDLEQGLSLCVRG